MQIPDQTIINTVLGAAATVIVTLGGQQWLMHRSNSKRIDYVLSEHVPHSHTERPGEALHESGIRYPKVRFNGNGGNGR